MDEVELKILDVNRNELVKKLIVLGAKKIFEGSVHTKLFDFRDRSLTKAKATIRIRKIGGKTVVTFKGYVPNKFAKHSDEIEIEITDYLKMESIFRSLGLRQILEAKKKRVSYMLDEARLDFDNYLGKYDCIPEYVEIEARSTAKLLETVKKMGFGTKDCSKSTFSDLKKRYCKQ
ncbi:MAG: class IV adenylate cyclase [Candidatus Woesearchaeota archaeon]